MTRRLAIAGAVLVLLSVWTLARPYRAAIPPVDFVSALPLAFDEWIGRDAPPLDPNVARVLGADQYLHRYYGLRTADRGQRIADRSLPRRSASADRRMPSQHWIAGSRSRPDLREGGRIADVEIDIAYYAQPQAGSAMHSPLNCLPGNGWQVVDARAVPVSHDHGTALARRLVVARGADRVAMTYWFQNRGVMVGNEYRQRLQLLANGLQGRPTDAALARVMALDTADGHSAMQRFSRALASRLTTAFR